MWDEEDGFYYDVLRLPDGSATRLKVRSMVGLLPLCATTVVEPWQRERVPRLAGAVRRAAPAHAGAARTASTRPARVTSGTATAASSPSSNPERLRRILARMLDEREFLSPYGIRALSRYHLEHPYVFRVARPGVPRRLSARGVRHRDVRRQLELARAGLDARERAAHPRPAAVLHLTTATRFQVECPTGSGRMMNLFEVAQEIAERLTRIFLRDERGRRPVYGGTEKFQTDPHWRDHILFYEYFHGDNGAGLGASHQTGWTGVVATLIDLFGRVDAARFLEVGKRGAFEGR